MDLSNLARTRQLLNDLTGESASVFRPITILTISFKISEVPYSKDLDILIVNNIAECSKKTLHPNARVSFKNKKEDEKLFITH